MSKSKKAQLSGNSISDQLQDANQGDEVSIEDLENDINQQTRQEREIKEAQEFLDRDETQEALDAQSLRVAKTFKVESIYRAIHFSVSDSKLDEKRKRKIQENIQSARDIRSKLLYETEKFLPENTSKEVVLHFKEEVKKMILGKAAGESIGLLLEQVGGRLSDEELQDMTLEERADHYRQVSSETIPTDYRENQKIYFFIPQSEKHGHSHVLLETYEDNEGDLSLRPVWIIGSLSWVQGKLQELRAGVKFEELQKALNGNVGGYVNIYLSKYIQGKEEFNKARREAAKFWKILLHNLERAVNFNAGKIGIDGESEERQKIEATEAARELAQEKGVDLSEVDGTGKDGRIIKKDIQRM